MTSKPCGSLQHSQRVSDVDRKRSIEILIRLGVAGLVIYALVARSGDLRANLSKRDSIAYWAAGQLLLQHLNPYDASSVLELERGQGYKESKPLVLRTPPWSLFMVLPLGVLDAFWAWVLWMSVCFVALVVAMRLCWRIYGNSPSPQTVFWLVGYSFAPVPACLVAGQMGILLLLGLVLFLWLEADRPFLSGAALLLPFAKPHLLSLFWLALIFWIVTQKRRAIVGGLIAAFLATTVVSLAFDPAIFQDYREMLYQASIGHEFIPALSGVVRLIFFRRMFWVQFIPMALGLVWCVWFCLVNRSNWDWRDHGLAVMVVSVLTTPYDWLTDEVVLLPAVLQAAMWICSAKQRIGLPTRLVIMIFACLNGLLLLILAAKVPFATGIYFWSSLVWFLWYVYARRFRATGKVSSEARSAVS